MRTLRWTVSVLLFMLGLALAVLTLGTFASLVPNGGTALWLRSLGSVEAALSGVLGLGGVAAFVRALLLTLVTGLVFALSTYLKPRA